MTSTDLQTYCAFPSSRGRSRKRLQVPCVSTVSMLGGCGMVHHGGFPPRSMDPRGGAEGGVPARRSERQPNRECGALPLLTLHVNGPSVLLNDR
jgi:hypothetical protein